MTFDEKAGNKSSYGHKKSKLKNPLLRSRSSKHEAGGSGGGGGGGFVTNGVIGGKVKIINCNIRFSFAIISYKLGNTKTATMPPYLH